MVQRTLTSRYFNSCFVCRRCCIRISGRKLAVLTWIFVVTLSRKINGYDYTVSRFDLCTLQDLPIWIADCGHESRSARLGDKNLLNPTGMWHGTFQLQAWMWQDIKFIFLSSSFQCVQFFSAFRSTSCTFLFSSIFSFTFLCHTYTYYIYPTFISQGKHVGLWDLSAKTAAVIWQC